MRIITTVNEMQSFSVEKRMHGKKIVLVPTMGYLHAGHLSLLKEGRQRGDVLVMSLFVNPIQFGPEEDFAKYARDFERDKKLAETVKTDVIFYPDAEQMYPPSFKTVVEVTELSDILCGKTRPGHFKGVTTVVLKLFNIILPHIAIFGEKDFQQLVIIKQMVNDLNIPVEIIGIPIVRDSDGLAISSRNRYLSDKEKINATSLSKGLRKALTAFKKGEKSREMLIKIIKDEIASMGLREDYIDIIDEQTLKSMSTIESNNRIVVGAYMNNTRLIDNISLKQ